MRLAPVMTKRRPYKSLDLVLKDKISRYKDNIRVLHHANADESPFPSFHSARTQGLVTMQVCMVKGVDWAMVAAIVKAEM